MRTFHEQIKESDVQNNVKNILHALNLKCSITCNNKHKFPAVEVMMFKYTREYYGL